MIQLKIDREKCVACGECIADCVKQALEADPDGYPVMTEDGEAACFECQHCMAVCPTGALSVSGKNPEESMPLDNWPDGGQMEQLIRGRRSVRRYKNEPVDPPLVARMLDIVSSAPTARNNMRLTYSVVEDPAVMNKVRATAYRAVRKAADSGALPSGLEIFESYAERWESSGADTIFRGAPHLLIASSPSGGAAPEADCVIGLSYFELLAQSMGIGTVWLGLGLWALTRICPELLARMNVPEDHTVGFVMGFGKPAVRYRRAVQRNGAVSVNRIFL